MTNAFCVILMYIGTMLFLPAPLGKDIALGASTSLDSFIDQIANRIQLTFLTKKIRVLFALISFICGSLFWYYWSSNNWGNKYPFFYVLALSMTSSIIIYICYKYLLEKKSDLNKSTAVYTTWLWITIAIATLTSLPLLLIPCLIYLIAKLWYLETYSILLFSILGYVLFTGGVLLFLITNP